MRRSLTVALAIVVVAGAGLIVWERTTSVADGRSAGELPLTADFHAPAARATGVEMSQAAAVAPFVIGDDRQSKAESESLTGHSSDPHPTMYMPSPLTVSSSLWVEKSSDACVGAWGFVSPQPHKDFEAWSCKAVAPIMQRIGLAPKERDDVWAEDMEYGLTSFLSSEKISPEVEQYGIRCSREGCIVLFEGAGKAVEHIAGDVHNSMHLQPWREDLRFIGFWWTRIDPDRVPDRSSAIVVLLRKQK